MLVFYFIIFLFGLAVGSFLNSIIYRLGKKEGFLKGRSYCPYCKHTLIWKDLIPLFSFLFLKGKCRYCHRKISLQYPLVEIGTGLLFLLIFNFQFLIFNQLQFCEQSLALFGPAIFNFQTLLTAFYLFVISCFLIIIFVYDLKRFIIPDKVIYPAITIALIYNIYQLAIDSQLLAINSFVSAFGAAAFFLSIVLLSQGRWMGVGDIKLAFLMGLLLGFPNILVALFLSFLIGAIIGTGLVLQKKKTFKSEIPFGPFLVTGTFIAMFWGKIIIQWYLALFI